jgi:uncharacterized membrane protein
MDWLILADTFKKLLLYICIFMGAYFAPVIEKGAAIMILVVFDTCTGIWASRTRQKDDILAGGDGEKHKITSTKMRRAIPKFVSYAVALTVALIFTNHFSFDILTFVAFFLASVEVKSIFENLKDITKIDFVVAIAKMLNQRIDHLSK